MIKTCLICKKEFETVYPNKKYCSVECASVATREADRLRKRNERKIIRERKSEEKLKLSTQRKLEIETIAQEKAKERKADLEARIKQGDPLARMSAAKIYSAEYWEAFKDYKIQYAHEWGRETKATINGISVLDDNFVEKVMESIKRLNVIRGNG